MNLSELISWDATSPSSSHEPGSATVLSAVTAVALVIVVFLVGQLMVSIGGKMDVRNSADLAALSSAMELRITASPEAACTRAREVAGDGQVTCDVEGENVTVTVTRPARYAWITVRHEAQATAGPRTTTLPGHQ